MNSGKTRLVPAVALVVLLVSCSQPSLNRLGTGGAHGFIASSPASAAAAIRGGTNSPRELIDSLDDCGGGDPALCIVPPVTYTNEVEPRRSLYISDRATLEAGDFSLARSLSRLAGQVGKSAVPETLNAIAAGLKLDDPVDAFQATALRNRLDRAPGNWSNCGEYHIVYRKPATGAGDEDTTLVLELVLPNPKPGCREGCLEVARFWKTLSAELNPATRAKRLEAFYYTGLPGFRPALHVEHVSAKGVGSSYGFSGGGRVRVSKRHSQATSFQSVLNCAPPSCDFRFVAAGGTVSNELDDLAGQRRFMLSLLNQSRCGCRGGHRLLADEQSRQHALYVQKRIASRFTSRIKRLQRQLDEAGNTLDDAQRHQLIGKLYKQMDREIEYGLRELKIKPPALDLAPDSLMLALGG